MHIAGHRGNDEAVRVQAMSEGMRDQLFLALAGLRVLVELSKKTQVLFFTHHQHLCDLARQAAASDRCVIRV